MSRRLARILGTAATVAGYLAGPAGAAAVNPPISVTPPNPVGTVLMLHQGGWSGPDVEKQARLMDFPGRLYFDRGWRTVSVDYAAGKQGLQSVKDAIGAELAQGRAGPLCLYGESAGAHLALLAAAQLPPVACVVAVGAPTDFGEFRAQAAADGNLVAAGVYHSLFEPTFGEPGPHTAAWEPAKVAPRINADVLMVRQGDDQVVPAGQLETFVKALPVVGRIVTAVGDLTDPSQQYLHGTLDAQARAELSGALGAFADRAVRNGRVAQWGRRQRCAQANGALGRIGAVAFRRSVACLVTRVRRRAGRGAVRAAPPLARGERIALTVVGQVTPARVVFQVVRRAQLQRAAARRVAVEVRQGARSAVTLRVA